MNLAFVPLPLLFGIAILSLLLVIRWRQKYSPAYLFFFSIFGAYLLVLAGFTLFPIPILNGSGEPMGRKSAAYIFSKVNLVIFDYSQYAKLDPLYIFLREIVANIFLTLPFGFGIRFVARISTRQVPWLGLAVGIGIETAQLAACLLLGLTYRSVDINDALMNALGVLLGYGCFLVFSRLVRILADGCKTEQEGLFAYLVEVVRGN